jgi:hypothetical protein
VESASVESVLPAAATVRTLPLVLNDGGGGNTTEDIAVVHDALIMAFAPP